MGLLGRPGTVCIVNSQWSGGKGIRTEKRRWRLWDSVGHYMNLGKKKLVGRKKAFGVHMFMDRQLTIGEFSCGEELSLGSQKRRRSQR
jgi:hypothetical protein